jgi:hypothetical protein
MIYYKYHQIAPDLYAKLNDLAIISHRPQEIVVLMSNMTKVDKILAESTNTIIEGKFIKCTCSKCESIKKPTFFDYDKLKRWYKEDQNKKVTCNESGVTFLVKNLIK